MRRLLWLGVGLAVGGLVVRAVSKKARAYSPSGLAGTVRQSAGGLADSVRSFVDDVRDGMAERERQIHEALRSAQYPPTEAGRDAKAGGGEAEDQEGIR